jgi:signal transduction histidine kinase
MMKEGKVVGLRSIVTDVTEHKRMEAQLAESSRLAAIGATTALVGHDLRNPLQGIAAAIHLLKTRSQASLPAHEEEAEQEEAELFDMIDDAVMYMDKIVSDLQNFAAPVHPEMASINTTEVLKETLSTMRIPSSLKVSINVSEGAEIMTADPVLVKRVFTNLITNAVQAMPRGGELKILARRDGDEHLISFHDTGVGIASETLPRLFEPFFTTKAIGQGLGLPVCKRLVEAHGGAITVDSILGNGSNFTVKLPASKGGG